MTATGKDIQRILTLAADQAPSTSAESSRPTSPTIGTTRSKLSAIQNLMAKQRALRFVFRGIRLMELFSAYAWYFPTYHSCPEQTFYSNQERQRRRQKRVDLLCANSRGQTAPGRR